MKIGTFISKKYRGAYICVNAYEVTASLGNRMDVPKRF